MGDLNGHNMYDPESGDYDGDDDVDYYSVPNTKKCNHCGTTNLVWKETKDGWRLAQLNGKLHDCPKFGGDDKSKEEEKEIDWYYKYVSGLLGDSCDEKIIKQLAIEIGCRQFEIKQLKDQILKYKHLGIKI